MNENARAWIKELKTTDKVQGAGYLNADNRFCCLGIACELAAEAGIVTREEAAGVVAYRDVDDIVDHKEIFVLPDSVRKWLGLRSDSGDFTTEHGDMQSLTELNDNLGASFARIAEVLRSEPEYLFSKENA